MRQISYDEPREKSRRVGGAEGREGKMRNRILKKKSNSYGCGVFWVGWVTPRVLMDWIMGGPEGIAQ